MEYVDIYVRPLHRTSTPFIFQPRTATLFKIKQHTKSLHPNAAPCSKPPNQQQPSNLLLTSHIPHLPTSPPQPHRQPIQTSIPHSDPTSSSSPLHLLPAPVVALVLVHQNESPFQGSTFPPLAPLELGAKFAAVALLVVQAALVGVVVDVAVDDAVAVAVVVVGVQGCVLG